MASSMNKFCCKVCGFYFDFDSADLEPAATKGDREDPNYDEETDSVVICPECYAREVGQDESNFKRYMSGVEYACGIRD